MRHNIWITDDDEALLDELNISPSELLKEAIEEERIKHNEFMKRRFKKRDVSDKEAENN